jgi:flagella basal body P-ring formation protein FlgA
MRTLATLLLLVLASVALARADDTGLQPVDSIRAAAESAIAPGAGTEARAAVDERLRMPACGSPLQAVPNGAGTVEVSCTDPAGWRLYVPVRVTRIAEVLVLTRPVAAGMPIAPDAVALERRDIARLSATPLDRPERVVGQVARRALPAGTVLTVSDLGLAAVIRRGQAVTLVARVGNLEVRASGRALGDGAPGDLLSVENASSRRVVQGVVQADGEVFVR